MSKPPIISQQTECVQALQSYMQTGTSNWTLLGIS
jgi:hypothetical protein